MAILIIDNYDSFTHNLQHYFEQLADEVTVVRNDQISLEEVSAYSHIVISPGPGLPASAGISMALIERFKMSKSILGVCLGCQALAEHCEGQLYNQKQVAHGLKRQITRTQADSWLLKEVPEQFSVGLYHSWAIDPESLNPEWRVVALSEEGVVMAIEHQSLPLAGVQFHPESIMSEYGLEILSNWLERQV